MDLTPAERLVCEALSSYVSDRGALGLSKPTKEQAASESIEHGVEHLHNHINQLFATHIAESSFFDGIRSAFNKVHAYKYLDHPTFHTALQRELESQGIPMDEQDKAYKAVTSVLEEVKKSQKIWKEQDAGFHPDLDEIIEISKPGTSAFDD